MSMSSTTKGST
uniref:Uncharacterized protein n=1 Tax=Arundo donax TaxID=35708 RepID=A0A0A9HMS9_ARUDO